MSEQITPNPSVPSQIVAQVKFPQFVNNLGIIPTSYKDSMSYYECLAWLCKYLEETVIPTVNENGEAVEELQGLYIELNSYVTHYFDNLDVQDEINNKLDEYVENGTFENYINQYMEQFMPSLKPNYNLDIKLGTTPLFHLTSDGGKDHLEKCLIYFDSIIQQVRLKFNTSTLKWDIDDPNYEDDIPNIVDYLQAGGKLAGIKFVQTNTNFVNIISTYTANVVFNAYLEKVREVIDDLPYKNQIYNVWIMNEAGNSVFTDVNSSYVIDVIEALQSDGYYVSTPYANAYALTDSNQDIIQANDFISLNLYPFNDVYGQKTSIAEMAERFNREYRLIERYLVNKDLYITEFGCSGSWEGFNYPPTYVNHEEGKPISVFIEGFFQSEFISKIKGAFLWYYVDAWLYAPQTLLSIKNNTEVRYNE